MSASLDFRPSPIAGKWYPGDPLQLARSVDGYLKAAKLPRLAGEVVAVVAPHAGHMYSGPVAGYAFATLVELQVELVVVVSPMHYPYPQPLLTTAHQAYRTPLGDVQVDEAALAHLDEGLQARLGYRLERVWHDQEHSVEIELPFLQRSLAGEFHLLPVMVREQIGRVARALGSALAEVLAGRKAIMVASTDLSHFYPQPTARILDEEMLRRLATLDPEAVLEAEEEGKAFACGHGALAAVMWASKELHGDEVKVLNYATSGDVTGDYGQVVGYGAAVVLRKGEKSGDDGEQPVH